jgi:hypothetical protein
VPFYRRENFWASSTAQRKGDARDGVAAISIPALDINALIARFRPTVLVVDIEGAEHGLFDAAELDGVRTMIVEFHPRLYGLQGVRDVTRALSRHGFAYDIKSTADTSTLVFSRAVEAPTSNAPCRSRGLHEERGALRSGMGRLSQVHRCHGPDDLFQ